MIVLAGATSFFVGNAFQAQMPEYAHQHGSEGADVWYSVLFGANAAGALIGAVALESVAVFQGGGRAAIVCAAIWAVVMAIFPLAHGYAAAVTLLVLAGVFNIAFTSMAQAEVQILAPPGLRGRVVGTLQHVDDGAPGRQRPDGRRPRRADRRRAIADAERRSPSCWSPSVSWPRTSDSRQ